MTNLFDISPQRSEGYSDVRPEQLFSEQSRTRVLDVREPSEFRGELGHIQGAELVPLGTLGAAAALWNRSADLVVVCRSGRRSERAARVLVSAGFSRVRNLVGGMTAWSAAKLPVER